MTLLNTSGVLVILTVILLLWFVPRSLRRAPAGHVTEPERPLISAERTAEDILASAGVLLNESDAYQSSDHAVAPGTSLPSSALPPASSSHAVDDSAQPAPDTASISQIRESSPTAPYTDAIPVVEESKPSVLSYFDTSSPSGIALLVAVALAGLGLLSGVLALFGGAAWGWAVLFLILAGGAWAVSRSGLLESASAQIKARRAARLAAASEEESGEEESEESDGDEEPADGADESVEAPVQDPIEEEEAPARPAARKPVPYTTLFRSHARAVRTSRWRHLRVPPRRLLARLLLVRKCSRLLRQLVPFARHLLVLPLLVLLSRLRLIALSVASSVRAASSRFAAVACSSTRRAVPLLRLPPLVLPPLLRLVPRGSPG